MFIVSVSRDSHLSNWLQGKMIYLNGKTKFNGSLKQSSEIKITLDVE